MTAIRRIQFCAGHRVLNHESKCANPHGHNYVALFHASAASLDQIGRVIDFSVLKERLGGWIEEAWDHKFLVSSADTGLRDSLERVSKAAVVICPFNPTAENMAYHLLHVVAPSLLGAYGVVVTKVELWETENCKVEVCLP